MKNILKFRSFKNKRQRSKSGKALIKGEDKIKFLNSIDTTQQFNQQHQPQHASIMPRVLGFILGSGSFSKAGCSISMDDASTHTACTTPPTSPGGDTVATTPTTASRQRFLRHSSSFLRVADLNLHLDDDNNNDNNIDDASSVTWSDSGNSTLSSFDAASTTPSKQRSVANFSYASCDPPPGVDHDPQERWIALDDGAGNYAPIAPRAVAALATIGYNAAMDKSMWTQHTAARHFRAAPWHQASWGSPSTSNVIHKDELPPPGSKQEEMVLLWTGKFQHGHYGSELPAVRAIGVIPAAPKDLFDMLIDSERVKEYNKMSLGREDLLVLQDSTATASNNSGDPILRAGGKHEGPFGCSKVVTTKVMRSKSSPPLVKSTMELVSMLHAQELDDGSGYLIVTRAVTHPEARKGHESGNVLTSEILLGVNIIRRVEGDPDRCVMINMIHIRSPMVPMIIANRIGATAASNFIRDLRNAF